MKMKLTRNIVREMLLVLVFSRHLILCSYSKDSYQRTSNTLCSEYNIMEITTPSEMFCATFCTRNKIFGCKGFCFDHSSKICKLYGLPDLGANSIRLEWIALKKLPYTRNYIDAIQECKNSGLWMTLPTTQDEYDGLREFANVNFRVDLNNLNSANLDNFTTYDDGKNPPMYFWADTQPNHLAAQNCVWSQIGGYNDLDCTGALIVFCQKPKPLFCKEGELVEDDQYDIINAPCYKMIKN